MDDDLYEAGLYEVCDYCEDDDWSVWLRPETCVWALLLLVQLSMVAFIAIHGRKDKSFREAFYVFFVVVTLVDCALAFLRTSREWERTIFGTVYDSPFTVQENPRTQKKQRYPTIRATINGIILHAVVPALGHAQPLFLTAIAANRFTAFAFPLKHASIWRTRKVIVVTVFLAATSVVLGSAYPVGVAIRQAVVCSRATAKQYEDLRCGLDTWAFEWINVPINLLNITSAICCIASFVINLGSISMLIALRITGKIQRRGPELRLFAHSLWMFALQLLLAFQDIVYVADRPAFTDESFLHSTEWLGGVNPTRRAADKYDWGGFIPGCDPQGWWGDVTLPKCSAWYEVLIGELRLRQEPAFTVRTLELCLFTLSGAAFLLIISGNVRTAYFQFYFKPQWLKKIRGQQSSVKVLTGMTRRA